MNAKPLKLLISEFKSKRIRIDLNQPILPKSKVETTEKVLKTVEGDRQYAIQATIVRYDLN